MRASVTLWSHRSQRSLWSRSKAPSFLTDLSKFGMGSQISFSLDYTFFNPNKIIQYSCAATDLHTLQQRNSLSSTLAAAIFRSFFTKFGTDWAEKIYKDEFVCSRKPKYVVRMLGNRISVFLLLVNVLTLLYVLFSMLLFYGTCCVVKIKIACI